MEIVFVVVGIAIVWLLWRMLNVQAARTRIEATRVAVEHTAREVDRATRVLGTPEDAKQRGRLIEYYDQTAVALGIEEETAKTQLMHSANRGMVRDLVVESIERGVPCRFLQAHDYDLYAPEVSYPGRKPTQDVTCSAFCKESNGDEETSFDLPADLVTCPFCGAPTKKLWPQELVDRQLADWQDRDRAWQLWKKRSPAVAASEEVAEMAEHERASARDRGVYQAALASFRAKHTEPSAPPGAILGKTAPPPFCPACPQCRAPTVLVAEFDRWRCDRCNIYA